VGRVGQEDGGRWVGRKKGGRVWVCWRKIKIKREAPLSPPPRDGKRNYGKKKF